MGSSITAFEDFMLDTEASFYSGPEEMLVDVLKNRYSLALMIRGRELSETLQGGDMVKDIIMLEDPRTFRHIKMNATTSWSNPQVQTEWKADWRWGVDHIAWNDQEVVLQGGANGSSRGRFMVRKRIKHAKERAMWTSSGNGLEEANWAVPVESEMEQTSGTLPYSIPAFVNEQVNGLYNSPDTGTWTTVQGINPTQAGKEAWKPQQLTYSNEASTGGAWTLFDAFEEMMETTRFEQVPMATSFFDKPIMANVIFTSVKGKTEYAKGLRTAQDHFTKLDSDPAYPGPTFNGIPVVGLSTLNRARLYPNSGGTGSPLVDETERTFGTAGPRYYWISRFINKAFHSERYFFKHPVMNDISQHNSRVMPVDIWHQTVCRSRARNGIVYPSVDVVYP